MRLDKKYVKIAINIRTKYQQRQQYHYYQQPYSKHRQINTMDTRWALWWHYGHTTTDLLVVEWRRRCWCCCGMEIKRNASNIFECVLLESYYMPPGVGVGAVYHFFVAKEIDRQAKKQKKKQRWKTKITNKHMVTYCDSDYRRATSTRIYVYFWTVTK